MMAKVERLERGSVADETATRWTQLEGELRMICRSLANPAGWTPEAVMTVVRLPGDAEYSRALGTLCRRLAAEYRLEQTLGWQGDDWCVRFARPVVGGKAVVAQRVPAAVPAKSGLRVAIARAYAAWRLPGLGAGQPLDAV